MKAFLIFAILVIASTSHALSCSNLEAVAKEAIELSLTGSGLPKMNRACYAAQTFKYFQPDEAVDDIEDAKIPQPIWYRQGRDSYTYNVIRRADVVIVDVKFRIAGEPMHTKYFYKPIESLQRDENICGFVYNDLDLFLREDCRANTKLVSE